MSKPLKVKAVKPKVVKEPKPPKEPKVPKPPKEPKEKKERAKKQEPTKEDTLKMLLDAADELKQIQNELKQEESKIESLSVPRLKELVKETLSNLEEDEKEIRDKHDELKNCDQLEPITE